jgi:hypothetical protein
MARNIAALGVRVIGDLAELGRPPDSLAQAEEDDWPAHALIPAEAAVRALVGAFIAGGVDGQAEADAAPVAPAAPARQAAPSPRQASPATQQPSPRQPVPPARQAAPSLTQASPAAQPAVLQQALPQQAPLQPDPSPPDPPQSDPPQSDPAPARPESRRAPQHASRPVDARGLSRVLAGLRRPRTRNTQRLSR